MGGNVKFIILLFGPATKAWVHCQPADDDDDGDEVDGDDVEGVEVENTGWWNLWKKNEKRKKQPHTARNQEKIEK